LITIIILASIGFIDATYLTVEHYRNEIPPCTVGGCENVLTSEYAQLYGVPVSLLGSIYYLLVLVSLFVYFDVKNEKVKDYCLKLIIVLSTIGFFASLGFIYLMLFVIKSICVYCMVADIVSILIFIMAWHIAYLGLIKKYE
jgi:uncharacterized membrane protein